MVDTPALENQLQISFQFNLKLARSKSKHYFVLFPVRGPMLKAPPLNSLGLHISVFQDRSERGAYNVFKKYVRKSSKIINWNCLEELGLNGSND